MVVEVICGEVKVSKSISVVVKSKAFCPGGSGVLRIMTKMRITVGISLCRVLGSGRICVPLGSDLLE